MYVSTGRRRASTFTRPASTSGAMTPGVGQQLLQIGFDAFVAKPFDTQHLIDAVDTLANVRL